MVDQQDHPVAQKCCIRCRSETTRRKLTKIIEVRSQSYSHFITTKHALYNLRYSMISRCYNAKESEYKHYQGKGITICDDWRNDPTSFYTWAVNNGWRQGLQIDRIDPDGNYEPRNCQFITASENAKRIIRPAFGQNTPNAKLSDNDVIRVKMALNNNDSVPKIAKEFNVSTTTIRHIRIGKRWSHIII